MPLPEQLRKQVEHADQVVAELTKPADDGTPPVATPDPESVTPPSGEVIQLKPEEDEKTWQERYKALQGIFDAKMPQLQAELRNSQALQDQQRQMIITLQGQLQQVQQTLPKQQDAASPVLTEDELRDYTPEFFSMMQRWLEPQLGPIKHAIVEMQRNMAPAVQQLSSQVQTVAHTQAVTREEKFFAELTKAVPNWERLNTDSRFIEWLGVVDPMTGISRHAYLNDARSNLDSGRASAIFSSFAREMGGATQSSSTSDLEKQVTVESSKRGAPPSGEAATKTYTAKDLEKLYGDWRRGVFKGREAEFHAKEQELLGAINAGKYVR